MFQFADNSKIGMFLVMAGLASYSTGVIFLFDRGLMLLGNICFLFGISLLIGVMGALSFFTKRGKFKASVFFFSGLFLIVLRLAFIGGLLQLWGLFSLFYSFLPHLFEWILSIPGIGPFLKHNRLFNLLMSSLDNRKKANI